MAVTQLSSTVSFPASSSDQGGGVTTTTDVSEGFVKPWLYLSIYMPWLHFHLAIKKTAKQILSKIAKFKKKALLACLQHKK